MGHRPCGFSRLVYGEVAERAAGKRRYGVLAELIVEPRTHGGGMRLATL